MPTLSELKRAANTALDWLWEWYWSQLDAAFGLPSIHGAAASGTALDSGTTDKLQNMLKTYVKGRKQEIKAKKRSDLCTAAASALSTYILRFSPSSTTPPSVGTQTALLRLLVADSQILPADKKLGSSMSGAFLVWSPLLLSFSAASASFFADLFKMVVEEMNNVDRRDEEREGLCEWAAHMLGSTDWRDARGSKERTMREKVLGDCMTEPGRWNLRLAGRIVDSMDPGEGEMWRAILDAGQSEVEGEVMVVDESEETDITEKSVEVEVRVGKVIEPPAWSEKTLELSEKKIKGPQKVVGLWKPKPIGWLPDGWNEDA